MRGRARRAGRVVAGADDESETISWGSAEFVAAEEMGRLRGYWWSPDGERLAVARVDTAPVAQWYIADPAAPDRPPTEQRYPAAGTANADVSLHIVGARRLGRRRRVGPRRVPVPDRRALGRRRPQHHGAIAGPARVVLRTVDESTGATTERWSDQDDDWVELTPLLPRLCRRRHGDRWPIATAPAGCWSTANRSPPTTPGAGRGHDRRPGVIFTANRIDDATDVQVWRWLDGELTALTDEPGVHRPAAGGGDGRASRHAR